MQEAHIRLQDMAGLAGSTGRAHPATGLPNTAPPAHPAQPILVCIADQGDAPDQGSSLGASHGPPACPDVTVPISIPLQRAQAVLQESKHARKHASQLAMRANETQRELSRQEHVAEKLRRDLEEAHQVSWAPSGRLSSIEPGRGFAHRGKHREQPGNSSFAVWGLPWGCSWDSLAAPVQPKGSGAPDLGFCLCWKVGTEVNDMAKSLQEARGSLIADIETLNDLLQSLGETGSCGRDSLLGFEALLIAGAVPLSSGIQAELGAFAQGLSKELLEGSYLKDSPRAERTGAC